MVDVSRKSSKIGKKAVFKRYKASKDPFDDDNPITIQVLGVCSMAVQPN